MTPGDPVVGSTILRRPAIQSPNYVAGVSGWSINADGSAEFNNLTLRGTFDGNDWILNSNGFFLYSGAPAAGNLAVSIVPGTGTVTDPEGNTAQPGVSAYATVGGDRIAVQLGLGSFAGSPAAGLFTHDQTSPATSDPFAGSLGNGTAVLYSGQSTGLATGSGIEAEDSVVSGVAGGEVSVVAGLFIVQQNAQVDGNLVVAGSLSVNGSTNTTTNGVSSPGTIGTSGPASAGTAHTHSAGTYQLGSGQHFHTL